jgi:hypothetical protein
MFQRVTLSVRPVNTVASLPVRYLPDHNRSGCREGAIFCPQDQGEEYCRALILGDDRVSDILPEENSLTAWPA